LVGTQGDLEIFIDGELFTSQSFTIEPAAGPAGGGGSSRAESVQQIALNVNTMDVARINELPVARLPNGFYNLAPGVHVDGQRAGVDMRGIGSSTGLGANNDPLVLVDGVPLGNTATGLDGNTYSDGDVDKRFSFETFGAASLERVEILKGPTGAQYGSDVSSGVVNIIAKRSAQEGYQGPFWIESVTGFRGDNNPIDLTVANNLAQYFPDLGLQRYTYVDWGAPFSTKEFNLIGPVYIGNAFDLADFARVRADFGSEDVTDVTPVTFEWQVSQTWEDEGSFFGIQTAQDIPASDNPWYLSLYATDAFGQSTRWIGRDNFGWPVGGLRDDFAPSLSIVPGAMNVAPFSQINTHGDWSLQADGEDPPAQGFTLSAGYNVDKWDFRLSYAREGEQGYVVGDAESYARIAENFELGYKLDLSAGIGEYLAELRGYDNADNPSPSVPVRFVYNHDQPLVSSFFFTGDTDGLFVGGSTIEIHPTIEDPLDIVWGAAGSYSPGLDLYYFSDPQTFGTPYDGTFTTQVTARFQYKSWFSRLEFTTGPRVGSGWYDFNLAGAGALNSAGLIGESLLDISSYLPNPGTPFFSSGAQSWFPDQASTSICNPMGGDCQGVPSMRMVSARGWWPEANGTPTLTEGQLMARKTLPDGRRTFTTLGDPVDLDHVPFSGGFEIQARLNIDAALLGLNEQYDGLSWAVRNDAGDLSMTDFWPLVVIRGVEFQEEH
jgi:outer membrane receptor protein involved in Fe transport